MMLREDRGVEKSLRLCSDLALPYLIAARSATGGAIRLHSCSVAAYLDVKTTLHLILNDFEALFLEKARKIVSGLVLKKMAQIC